MQQSSDLLGDPIVTLPEGQWLEDLGSLVGHTVKAVIARPARAHRCRGLVVTQTNCFLALMDEQGLDGAGSMRVAARLAQEESPPKTLHDFADAAQLWKAGVISREEFVALSRAELAEIDAMKAARRSELVAELSAIDSAPDGASQQARESA